MSTDLLSNPEALVAQWRASAADNPAGPLFTNRYAEADLIGLDASQTIRSCSSCTASRTAQCC